MVFQNFNSKATPLKSKGFLRLIRFGTKIAQSRRSNRVSYIDIADKAKPRAIVGRKATLACRSAKRYAGMPCMSGNLTVIIRPFGVQAWVPEIGIAGLPKQSPVGRQ